MPLSSFAERGYAVVPAVDRVALDAVRSALAETTRELLGDQGNDTEALFNQFHERGIGGAELNDLRVAIIQAFNSRCDAGRLVFEAFRPYITALCGADVVVQRSANIVISQPHDDGVGPLHQDSPANSPFEIVVWLPMVDCFGSKSMLTWDRPETEAMVSTVRADPTTFEALDVGATGGNYVTVKYGEALIFWTSLFHRTPINTEAETRWSFNIRYKNLFSPYGAKGLLDYFRLLEASPLTTLALDEAAARGGHG